MHLQSESIRSPRAVGWSVFVVAMTAGLVVRIPSFGASLWLDELTTLWSVDGRLIDVLHRVPQVMGQSPFYFAIAWASVHLFGETEVALRLPSLLAMGACAAAVGLCAKALSGRLAAGLWATALFWCSCPAVWFSIDARPYAVAQCFAAIGCLGFVRSVRLARGRDRALWIAGVSGAIWSNVLFAPFVASLCAGYVCLPVLRRTWRPRAFSLDAALVVLTLAPLAPQVHQLFITRGAHEWVVRPATLGVFGLLAPFALAALMRARSRRDATESAVTLTFWVCCGMQFLALGGALLFGTNLFVARYASVVMVAGAVLAGANLARLARADLVAPLAIFVAINGLSFYETRIISGSWSGAGYQDWRGAVADLRPLVARDPAAPVLYRSGNAEDDPGSSPLPWPAWRAPLRSPGETAPDWRLVGLTYLWNDPERAEYFETVVRPRIEDQPVFYLLCLSSGEADANSYCGSVEQWIDQRWPGVFRAEPLQFHRQLWVARFTRAGAGR